MSTPPLFLLDSLPDGDALELLGEEGHHAARVRRLGVGELLVAGDGRGLVATCRVTRVRPDGLDLQILSRSAHPQPSPRLVLVQALPKGDRGELTVELATELGADEVVPWAAARCVTRWNGARGDRAHARWARTAREAAKQSRRPWVPAVTPLAETTEVVTRLRAAAGLVLHESAASPLATAPLPADGDLLVIVGPEGGVSDEEASLFTGAGATCVRLGRSVLRTSTAGAAALAALSLRLGRWD
ncbi:MAG: 16S rRNA (uracil(1498)-N(3))-methyltransferase [Jatrophihabitans sp.]|nr:MAG: 16S rRNA (uracil(1498)-N(3))-methyltransferase [Jatrophihabitans sp.]